MTLKKTIDTIGNDYSMIEDNLIRVIIPYFISLGLMLIGWFVYAICVWCKLFTSWMRQQRYFVFAAFQWTAIIISFSEIVMARPAIFENQYYMLIACIFMFSRMGFVLCILCVLGTTGWYLLSSIISIFALADVHPVVTGTSDYDKLVACGKGLLLSMIIAMPAYYDKARTNKDHDFVNKGLGRLVDLRAKMEERVNLITTVFPRAVGLRLANQAVTYAKSHASSSIMFFKICGLAEAAELTQQEAYHHLCNIICTFDELSKNYDVEKIKAIGPIYMAASGLPEPVESHATAIADMALACCKYLQQYAIENDITLTYKVGLASGRVVAGVIGTNKLIYDVFGDTVNTASRMYSHCPKGEIQCPVEVEQMIRNDFELVPHPKGKIKVKGKGLMRTFFVKQAKIQEFKEMLPFLENIGSPRDMKDQDALAEVSEEAIIRRMSRAAVALGLPKMKRKEQSKQTNQAEQVNTLLQSLDLHRIVIDYFMDPFKSFTANQSPSWFRRRIFEETFLNSSYKRRRDEGAKVTPFSGATPGHRNDARRNRIPSEDYFENLVKDCQDQLSSLQIQYITQMRGQNLGNFRWLAFLFLQTLLSCFVSEVVAVQFMDEFVPLVINSTSNLVIETNLSQHARLLQAVFITPCVLALSMLTMTSNLAERATFYLTATLYIFIGIGILCQMAFGDSIAHCMSFLLLMCWIVSFSYFTHVTKTIIVCLLVMLLIVVVTPIMIFVNEFPPYLNSEEIMTVDFAHEVVNSSKVQSVIFADVSVIFITVAFLLSSSSHEHHKRKTFLKHKALSSFYAAKQEVGELLDNVVAKLPLTEPAIKSFQENGNIDQVLFDTFSTVLFADIVSFTTFSSSVEASQLVMILNSMFIKFDKLAGEYGIEKIKTIGDCYVAATGIFNDWTKSQEPTVAMVQFAQQMHLAMDELNEEFGTSLHIRVGVHCGPVVAGIMGVSRLAFDLWGPTVEAANEIEAMGTPDKVHISNSVYQRCAGHFGPVFTKINRLTAKEQKDNVKKKGYEAGIDVPGYYPADPTTWLIDKVKGRADITNDLYSDEPSFSTSVASASLFKISRPVIGSVSHDVHVEYDPVTKELSGLPEDFINTLSSNSAFSETINGLRVSLKPPKGHAHQKQIGHGKSFSKVGDSNEEHIEGQEDATRTDQRLLSTMFMPSLEESQLENADGGDDMDSNSSSALYEVNHDKIPGDMEANAKPIRGNKSNDSRYQKKSKYHHSHNRKKVRSSSEDNKHTTSELSQNRSHHHQHHSSTQSDHNSSISEASQIKHHHHHHRHHHHHQAASQIGRNESINLNADSAKRIQRRKNTNINRNESIILSNLSSPASQKFIGTPKNLIGTPQRGGVSGTSDKDQTFQSLGEKTRSRSESKTHINHASSSRGTMGLTAARNRFNSMEAKIAKESKLRTRDVNQWQSY